MCIIYQDKVACTGWIDYGLLFPAVSFLLLQNKVLMWREEVVFYNLLEIMKNVNCTWLAFISIFFNKISFYKALVPAVVSVDWSKPGVWFRIKSAPGSSAHSGHLTTPIRVLTNIENAFYPPPPSFISLAPVESKSSTPRSAGSLITWIELYLSDSKSGAS